MTYTTLYVPSVLHSAACNCIITLMLRMYIDFQLTPMAPTGSRKGKGTAQAKMATLFINQRLLMDRDGIQGIISEHIR